MIRWIAMKTQSLSAKVCATPTFASAFLQPTLKSVTDLHPMARVEIYTSPFCGYCHRAKQLLRQKGVAYSEIDVMADSAKRQEMVVRAHGGRTVPQIFINEQHIGGCDDLYALDQQGGLDPLLAAPQ
jgi:glutaredoxin 3